MRGRAGRIVWVRTRSPSREVSKGRSAVPGWNFPIRREGGAIDRSFRSGGTDRDHILQLLPQKVGEMLDRGQVRDSIRALYATGRFADIQAEVAPSGAGVALTFSTSPNFFVGAVEVEGAPAHPTSNQIVNASKLQLGELFTQEKLDRALENVRQLMQENGYYRARVTAESTAKAGNAAGGHSFSCEPGRAGACGRSEGNWHIRHVNSRSAGYCAHGPRGTGHGRASARLAATVAQEIPEAESGAGAGFDCRAALPSREQSLWISRSRSIQDRWW